MDERTDASAKRPVPPGFANMTPERKLEVASMGARALHASGKAHVFTEEERRLGAETAGKIVSQDRDHMATIGRLGGASISQDREHMREIAKRGGRAVSADREHMREIGRIGRERQAAKRAAK